MLKTVMHAVESSVDPDQTAPTAVWSGSTMFVSQVIFLKNMSTTNKLINPYAQTGKSISEIQRDKGYWDTKEKIPFTALLTQSEWLIWPPHISL